MYLLAICISSFKKYVFRPMPPPPPSFVLFCFVLFFSVLECFVAIDLSSLFSFVIRFWSDNQCFHSHSAMMLKFHGLNSALAFCVFFEVSSKRSMSMPVFSIICLCVCV